jgi:hypothetical protein
MLTSITFCMRARTIPAVTDSTCSFMTHAFTFRAKSWWKLSSHTLNCYSYTYLNYPPTIHYNTRQRRVCNRLGQHSSGLMGFWRIRIIGKDGEKSIVYNINELEWWEIKELILLVLLPRLLLLILAAIPSKLASTHFLASFYLLVFEIQNWMPLSSHLYDYLAIWFINLCCN